MRRTMNAAAPLVLVAGLISWQGSAEAKPATKRATALRTPIRHLVIQIDENNSFERILGDPCRTVQRATPCNVDPATGLPYDVTQTIHTFDHKGNAVTVTPFPAGDIPPGVDHGPAGQIMAMNNQWASVAGCPRTLGCFGYLPAGDLQAEVSLLQQGTIADNYHSANPVPSWNGHTDFVTAAQLGGFVGTVPTYPANHVGGRWACNGNDDAQWRDPNTGVVSLQPSCYPSTLPGMPGYNGAYRPSLVAPDIPTLFEDLDAAGVSWRIYGSPAPGDGSYQFSMCPAFASCIYTSDHHNLVADAQYFTDVAAGRLPEVSFFLPGADPAGNYSQHNFDSIRVGENMTARVFNAMIAGPGSSSSVLVKTWDDCGCFWSDELGRGVGQPSINGRLTGPRIPALFAGAYVKVGGTDSTPSDTTSIDALIEWLFGAGPIGPATPDTTAYDFRHVFDFMAKPRRPADIPVLPVSAEVRAQLAGHVDDPTDPT